MIAAAVAAMTAGAFASLCDDDPDPEVYGCAVYDVQIKVKTLVPAKFSCKKYGMDDTLYFKDGNRTFDGIIWMCDTICEDYEEGPNFVLWEKKTKNLVSAPLAWNGTTWEADVIEWVLIDRYSKAAEKVEAVWETDFDQLELTLAGFGKFDKKLGLPKDIAGNCAGLISPAAVITPVHCEDPEEAYAKVFPLCDEFEDWCCDGDETEMVAASGTWSIKYNKKLSSGSKSLKRIVPSYAL